MADVLDAYAADCGRISRVAMLKRLKSLQEKEFIAMRGEKKSATWHITRRGVNALGEEMDEDPFLDL